MPRPRPQYLHREVTRHGTVAWYVRVDHGPRIRIRASFGTPDFQAEYDAARSGQRITSTGVKFNTQTFGWLIARYRETDNAEGTWGNLSPATRAQREPFLHEACNKAGTEPIARITRVVIEKSMAVRTPAMAKHFLYAMRGLFQWAVAAGHCTGDPTVGVKAMLPKSDGHLTWSADWCRMFEARWARGTPERLDYDVLYFTGLRIGDAVRLGRQHLNAGGIRAEKTGKWIPIPIDEMPELAVVLAAAPANALTFITGRGGRPMTSHAFGARFRRAARIAGVPGTAHGLRKTRATLIVEAGGTDAELNAFMGWTGTQMAQLYTRSRDQALLARRAAAKANEKRTSIPAPAIKVRALERKRP
jgi:site-specific recombinase XerD